MPLEVMLLIPFVLFAFLVLATRYSWKLIFLLLLVGPFLATALLIAGAAAFTDIGGLPPSFRDWVSFILTMYLLILPMAIIYPRSACVAILALLGWTVYERSLGPRNDDRNWRILIATGIGIAAGALFALLIFLAYRNSAFADFVAAGDITSRRLPPLAVPTSILTGAVDGALIAIFGVKSARRDQIVGAVAGATT
jgi:hypothetical protein